MLHLPEKQISIIYLKLSLFLLTHLKIVLFFNKGQEVLVTFIFLWPNYIVLYSTQHACSILFLSVC